MMVNCRSDIAAEIKSRLTMADVAYHYGFEPNRAGFISCPFHQGDRTASLKLYPGSGGFYCFGCGAHGSVIDFVMRLFSLSYPQAVVRLSSDFRLGLTQAKRSKREASEILQKRRAEEETERRRRGEYLTVAEEHRYWWNIQKYFCPESYPDGKYIHPLYAEALKRLPDLEYWLDENIGR